MKPRNLLVAAVVLAALSGGVWWAKKHPPSASPAGTPTASSPKIADIPERDIKSVDLRKKDGSTVTLQKENGKWMVTAPQQWKADNDAATALVGTLSPITSDSVVEEKSGDLAKYGLNAPSLDVTVHKTNGKSEDVLFGDDVPAGSLVYVRTSSDPKIYAVASSVKTALDKSVNDLRDKRLLTFDTNQLTRIDLDAGKSGIEFGKNNANEWQILKPQPYRADSFQVEELLRKLGEAKMDLSGSADDAKKAAANFAAGKPVSSVKVADSAGTQTLDVRKDKDDYYAKSSVLPGAYKVSADLGKTLEKPLEDYRNKKVFDFGFSDPTKIGIQTNSGSKQLVRSGTDWKMDGKTMDAGNVQAFIDKLRDVAAAKFETSGFTSPALTVTVTSNEGKRTEKVAFAKNAGGYLAQRENDQTLYHIDAKPVNDILEASNAIKPAGSSKK